jgi:hypothetical protein
MPTFNESFHIVIPSPGHPSSVETHRRSTATAAQPALVPYERARAALAGGSLTLLGELAVAMVIVAARTTQRLAARRPNPSEADSAGHD